MINSFSWRLPLVDFFTAMEQHRFLEFPEAKLSATPVYTFYNISLEQCAKNCLGILNMTCLSFDFTRDAFYGACHLHDVQQDHSSSIGGSINLVPLQPNTTRHFQKILSEYDRATCIHRSCYSICIAFPIFGSKEYYGLKRVNKVLEPKVIRVMDCCTDLIKSMKA